MWSKRLQMSKYIASFKERIKEVLLDTSKDEVSGKKI